MEVPKVNGNWLIRLREVLRKRSLNEDYTVFRSLLEYDPNAKLLDLGCNTGFHTQELAKSVGTNDVTGIEEESFEVPFKLVVGNIDDGLPFENESFDVVTASHVIEHVSNTDLFAKEVYRVLKPEGYAVIATPNMANGRTILELLFNKQPYIAQTSDFFLPRGYPNEEWKSWWLETQAGGGHRRLFTMEGLVKLLVYYGFRVEYKIRQGYGPIPLGKILRGMYAANLVVKVRKI